MRVREAEKKEKKKHNNNIYLLLKYIFKYTKKSSKIFI